jgi:SAM-dependent methyltransferase
MTSTFNIAYQTYYDVIDTVIKDGFSVLEIGGGRHPSIRNRKGLDYTIVDPDNSELTKSPEDIKQINCTIQELEKEVKYDLIISKMVLEHVKDPDSFHKQVLELLKPNGSVIHFFACRNSLPALVNRLLPEAFGDMILKMINNRNLEESPKYEAYYKRTKGHVKSQIEYFLGMGYIIEEYNSFVGHKYFKSIPILGYFEKIYTKSLVYLKLKSISTVALVVLSNSNNE